jgi:CRP-like cAMP-binding protein
MRLKMVDLVQDMEFDFPLTQNDLADLLGLSAVHTNRSLQELRKLGLISLHGRRLKILNFDELRELSFFDDAYFHIDGDVSG